MQHAARDPATPRDVFVHIALARPNTVSILTIIHCVDHQGGKAPEKSPLPSRHAGEWTDCRDMDQDATSAGFLVNSPRNQLNNGRTMQASGLVCFSWPSFHSRLTYLADHHPLFTTISCTITYYSPVTQHTNHPPTHTDILAHHGRVCAS